MSSREGAACELRRACPRRCYRGATCICTDVHEETAACKKPQAMHGKNGNGKADGKKRSRDAMQPLGSVAPRTLNMGPAPSDGGSAGASMYTDGPSPRTMYTDGYSMGGGDEEADDE